ncbi:SacI homology domain-domain-containing protein [Protomyces lactucae-debilis]|uniref:SacI homology domain-domain-containing protein n=1 Tax=Protomyces lactucae-debilis TaxID=2754530 RepID=A0A1Y2FFJ2_PROLT|nr:SacI homology domain-containing protein [Protomyces lactucae-debilis]ORY81595.1 SacI homology domain-domain-containing protein [Protomyces lactucae-debilis]
MNQLQCLTSVRLYETATRYYIIGCTQDEQHFSVLKIDRTVEEDRFLLVEDDATYSKAQINELLVALDSGNASTGGLTKILTCCGIIGLIRFTANFYISVITKRSIVALLGGHYIYHVENTKLIPLHSVIQHKKRDRNAAEEARYLAIWQSMEINKTFYYSNTYDITHTLQYNLTNSAVHQEHLMGNYNEMFVWNHHLLHMAFATIRQHSNWCVPLIHGFIDQAKLMIFGKPVYVTLIARRSRHFAGARFLKRGANERGYVANDVESEQIVSEAMTTPFHRPDGTLNGQYTSYVQHRGSIPLNWSQPVDGVNPKPPIELNVIDPFFSAAALHFDHMFERYGSPIYVINLIKQRERTPRETLLLQEFNQMIAYLNQFLPKEHKLRYIAWDMSRAAKSRDEEVIERLESIACESINATGIFCASAVPTMQHGVARTNCIDCLDRTNAAQFVIGKHALSVQLHALGLVNSPADVKYDCDAVSMIIEMFHDHGDTIALQYGGSHLVNTMETYRKINQWSSHSRDMIESIRRFYHNSFLDAQRQDAINLFLGNFRVPGALSGHQHLWEMENDYKLHFNDAALLTGHRHYRFWWTPKHLQGSHITDRFHLDGGDRFPSADERYWQEYYRPGVVSSIDKIFAFHMNSTARYLSHASPSRFVEPVVKDEKVLPLVDTVRAVPKMEEVEEVLASLLVTKEADQRIYQEFLDRARRPDDPTTWDEFTDTTTTTDLSAADAEKAYERFVHVDSYTPSEEDVAMYRAAAVALAV